MFKMIKKQIAKKKALKEMAEMRRDMAKNTLDIIDNFGGVANVPASVVKFCMATDKVATQSYNKVREM